MTRAKGFTLIELLIVVAIIAILAAIAVPNFLEAQTRSKVSRVKADQRSLATAIEAYTIDYNRPPMIIAITSAFFGHPSPANGINGPSVFNPGTAGVSSRLVCITTPVSYFTSIPRDPFITRSSTGCGGTTWDPLYDTFDYVDSRTLTVGGIIEDLRASSICSGALWHLNSAGPDLENCFGGGYAGQSVPMNEGGCDYDPTNGTISRGDVVRIASGAGEIASPTRVPKYDRARQRVN